MRKSLERAGLPPIEYYTFNTHRVSFVYDDSKRDWLVRSPLFDKHQGTIVHFRFTQPLELLAQEIFFINVNKIDYVESSRRNVSFYYSNTNNYLTLIILIQETRNNFSMLQLKMFIFKKFQPRLVQFSAYVSFFI